MLKHFRTAFFFLSLLTVLASATCKYSFKDTAPIPPEVKTFRVQQLENKAQYVKHPARPQLTERVKQKIINTTRLHQTNQDDAHYDIAGYISNYLTSTVNIQNNVSGTNRLTVTFHLVFRNTLDATKNFETDISHSEDFPASQSITEAESVITPLLVKDISDDIFNKIFSNW